MMRWGAKGRDVEGFSGAWSGFASRPAACASSSTPSRSLAPLRIIASCGVLFAMHGPLEAQRRAPREQPNVRPTAPCVVDDVHDGDTVRCTDGRRLRLLLIDAPELGQRPWGQRARGVLRGLAPRGDTLRVELDRRPRDRYRRLLAYLYARDGTFLNREMVAQGYAVSLVYAENDRYEMQVRTAEMTARLRRNGLWKEGGFDCRPADFRRRRCR
jgi:micrococcal nuclease